MRLLANQFASLRHSLSLLLLCSSLSVFVQRATAQADERGFIVQVGEPMPAFTLTDLKGNQYSNESLRGTTYVLQFTASWCGVCRKEMPHLEKDVWQAFRDRSFILLGVDLDEPEEKVATFAASTGVTYPMAPDSEGQVFYSIAGPKTGVTRNVVVDSTGKIVFLTRLFDSAEFAEMIQLIDRLTEN